jgi:hypothetical protein
MGRVRAPAILLISHHPSGTLGEVAHGVEDRPDEMFSILSALSRPGGCRFQETLDSPLLARLVCRFNDSVGVGDDQVARIKLHEALLIA